MIHLSTRLYLKKDWSEKNNLFEENFWNLGLKWKIDLIIEIKEKIYKFY